MRHTHFRLGPLRQIQCRSMAMQQWTVGPAVLPSLSDEAINHNLTDANKDLMQAVTAHLTSEPEWLYEDDEDKLRTKLASVMIDMRNSGKAALSPDCSPIFKELV